MYVFFFPLLSSLQSKAAKPSEEGFLRPYGSKRQSRARGGLKAGKYSLVLASLR